MTAASSLDTHTTSLRLTTPSTTTWCSITSKPAMKRLIRVVQHPIGSLQIFIILSYCIKPSFSERAHVIGTFCKPVYPRVASRQTQWRTRYSRCLAADLSLAGLSLTLLLPTGLTIATIWVGMKWKKCLKLCSSNCCGGGRWSVHFSGNIKRIKGVK